MSSTNKTSLGLNMWEASDKPVRQDFINDNVIIDEKITQLNSNLDNVNSNLDNVNSNLDNVNSNLDNVNSNFVKNNMEYHARIYLTSGWISGTVKDMIAQGYKGGEIQLVGYAPPDTYATDPYGIIKWILITGDIAYLQFIRPRVATIINRSISSSESFDTGWVVH